MGDCPRIASVATAVPPHVVRQPDVRALVAALFSDFLESDRRLIQVFDHAHIEKRHFCAPMEWLAADRTFTERNNCYLEAAVALAGEAARTALDRAGLDAHDIDHIIYVSSTGIATPSVDARLCNTLDLRPDCRRTPIWGLGCAGGVAGLARARDIALGDPSARILFIALELCSVTFQRNELSRRNLVATSLFADGAAAAIVTGSRVPTHAGARRTLEVVATHSTLWKDTLDVMGWTVESDGLHVVFSRDIPALVQDKVRPSLEAFLATHGLTVATIRHLVMHPGGAKVLGAFAEALHLEANAYRHAREVLRDFGNMSSPTCLFVLDRFLDSGEIGDGEHAVMMALGPGFSAEYLLLRGTAR